MFFNAKLFWVEKWAEMSQTFIKIAWSVGAWLKWVKIPNLFFVRIRNEKGKERKAADSAFGNFFAIAVRYWERLYKYGWKNIGNQSSQTLWIAEWLQ